MTRLHARPEALESYELVVEADDLPARRKRLSALLGAPLNLRGFSHPLGTAQAACAGTYARSQL